MSTKKEIWRLLEPGVDTMAFGDEWALLGAVWEPVGSAYFGDKVGVHASQHVNLVRRRMTLPEPQGWISVKERMPTKEDGGSSGCVIWARKDGGIYREYWDTRMGPFPDYWMPIPSFPDHADPDEDAFEKLWEERGGAASSKDSARSFFLAGRKSVATEKEAP